jgi:DNA modification methylase
LGEKGSWDVGELKAEFEELIIADAPIEITGFGPIEIDRIITPRDQADAEAAELAPLPGGAAIAQVGDLFLLGPHRVICGNAADPDLVNRLMRTDVARMVLTDAPSPVAFGASVTVSDPREDVLVSAAMTEETTDADFLEFNRNWMSSVLPHLVDGGLLGSFIDWRGLPLAHAAATDLGLAPLDLIVWATSSAGTGGLYQSQHRLLPFFKKGSAAHVNNSSNGKRGRQRSNVWTYSGPSLESDARRGQATKPTSLLEDALSDLTNRGELVLDSFLGSGSTLIAAENTGRVCCGVERDPHDVDIIIRRFEASTGIAAILADSGETFEKVATRRRNDQR